MTDIFAHIRPNTRITWNHVSDRFYVLLDNLGLGAFTGKEGTTYVPGAPGDNLDKVTIFTPDAETAIRLCGTLRVIRQRITNNQAIPPKVATVDDRLFQARADIARITGASVESVL